MKRRDTVVSMISGVLISVGILLLLTGIASKILISGRIGEQNAKWLVLLSLIIASMLGCIIPSFIRQTNATVPMIIAAGNLVLVTCCSFLMDGPFHSAWETLMVIVLSGTISCVICMKKPARNRKRKKHYR